MTSEEETSSQKSGTERKRKTLKKLVLSPNSSKSKKSSSIIKKLKFKSKSALESCSSSTSEPGENKTVVESSIGSSLFERQNPEGDDSFLLAKSASETNLQETRQSLSSTENTEKTATDSACHSEKDKFKEQKISVERTKSLENLKDMLTYGELIMDKAVETVILFFYPYFTR